MNCVYGSSFGVAYVISEDQKWFSAQSVDLLVRGRRRLQRSLPYMNEDEVLFVNDVPYLSRDAVRRHVYCEDRRRSDALAMALGEECRSSRSHEAKDVDPLRTVSGLERNDVAPPEARDDVVQNVLIANSLEIVGSARAEQSQ